MTCRQFREWERGRIMGQIRTREVRQERRSNSLGVPNSIRNSKELNILPEKEEVDDRILDRGEEGKEGGLAIVCRFQLAASHLDGGNDNGAKISLPIIRPIHLIPRSLARSLSPPSHQDKASSDTNEGSTPPKSRARSAPLRSSSIVSGESTS